LAKATSVDGLYRRLTLLGGVLPVLVAATLALYRPTPIPSLDNAAYDAVLRLARTKSPSDGVVIIDVDEQSLSTIGQWPWPRDVVSRLIGRAREMGAAVIALDIIFAERDRYDGITRADAAADEAARISTDDLLADELRKGRVVLGYAFKFEEPRTARSACVLHPLGLVTLRSSEEFGDSPYFQASGAVCDLPALSQAAGASGFLNAAPDGDGVLRRAPLLVELDGRVYPGLALSAVAAATRIHDMALRVSNVNASSLLLDNQSVPIDGKSNLLLRFRGRKKTFPYVSAASVLSGEIDTGALRNKIVFVGTTALGTREVVATPLDTLFAGVEVQATVADNLLQQDFVHRPQLGTVLESQLTLVLGIALAVLVTRRGLLWGAAGAIGLFASLWGGAVWLLSSTGTFVSPLCPTIGLVPALPLMTLAKFMIERRRSETERHEKATARRFMIQTLLSLTETRDPETGRHSRRTQEYARVLAEQLAVDPGCREHLTPEWIDLFASLAPLHDIGKVGVPDHILNKPGPLTPEELEEMRKHPAYGRDVILKAERNVGVRDDAILSMAKDIVYTHHEKWDGSGYPQGLRGEEIPLAGRLMALVDVYDAAISRALYRQPISHEAVVEFILRGSATHFDPAVVAAFVKVAPVFKRLSNGLQ
jgi:adenylate cyclase